MRPKLPSQDPVPSPEGHEPKPTQAASASTPETAMEVGGSGAPPQEEGVDLGLKPGPAIILGARAHQISLNGRAIAPYGSAETYADFILHYGLVAMGNNSGDEPGTIGNKAEIIKSIWNDKGLGNDHSKGLVLRHVLLEDPAIYMGGDNAAADESALFTLVRTYGDTALKVAVAEDIAKDWDGTRKAWHADGYEALHRAFQVKVHQLLLRPDQEERAKAVGLNLEAAFQGCQENTWNGWNEDFKDIAKAAGWKAEVAIFSEGRSSGWAVPHIGLPVLEPGWAPILNLEDLQAFLKHAENLRSDDENRLDAEDLLFMAERILVTRQMQCVVDETMSRDDEIWQAWVEQALLDLEGARSVNVRDEVAVWVGLHYGRNFEKESPEKQAEWLERYRAMHSQDEE